jgi:hypothetical protein
MHFYSAFVTYFLKTDVRTNAVGIERFEYRPGSGRHSEGVNLHVSALRSGWPTAFLVRPRDWKTWFHNHVHSAGTQAFFGTPTAHEADAGGIALYLGCILLPRVQADFERARETKSQPLFRASQERRRRS